MYVWRIIILMQLVCMYADGFAQDTCKVFIDATHLYNAQVDVTIITPALSSKEVLYLFTKSTPFDNLAEQINFPSLKFKAYDVNNVELPVKINNNGILIQNADRLHKIQYTLAVSQQLLPNNNYVFNDNAYLNISHSIGYFKGYNFLFSVTVYHNSEKAILSALSALKTEAISTQFESYYYQKISGDVIIISNSESTVVRSGNSNLHITLCSENAGYNVSTLAPYLQKGFHAALSFMTDIQRDNYFVNIILVNTPAADINNKEPDYGGMHHASNLFISMPLSSDSSKNMYTLQDILIHELLHDIIPGKLYSEKTFASTNDIYSQHLWLFEGVTEYFTKLAELRDTLISFNDFISLLSDITEVYTTHKTFSLTDASKHIFSAKYSMQYDKFYTTGLLTACMLDIKLRELSSGNAGLETVVAQLIAMHNGNAFQDDSLFSELVYITYPDINNFIKNYLQGKTQLPIKNEFNKVGLQYRSKKIESIYTFGDFVLRTDDNTHDVYFEAIKFTTFQAQKGDILLKVNNENVTPMSVKHIYDTMLIAKQNDKISVEIKRNKKVILLEGNAIKALKVNSSVIKEMQHATPNQFFLKQAVFGI